MITSLTFISMAVRNVIRNRQKTVTSVLGIILAVTLIFGETISLELQSGAILGYEMEEGDSHFQVYGSTLRENGTELMREIHDDLTGIEYSGEYNFRIHSSFPYTSAQPTVYLADYNISNESYTDVIGTYGDLVRGNYPASPDRGSVILLYFLQERFSLVIGQTINLTFASREYIWNDTGQHLVIRAKYFTRSYTIGGFWGGKGYYWNDYRDEPYYPEDHWDHSWLYLHGDDFLEVMEGIMAHPDQENISRSLSLDFSYYMRFDPSLYEGTNIYKARERADEVKKDLEELTDEYQFSGKLSGLEVSSDYEDAFEDTAYYFDDVKYIIIALSIPIILFGLYLGYLGIDLFLTERRREIGMLKARGANRGTLMVLLITESLFVGAVAGAIGIILAGYGSKLIMSFTQASSAVDIPWYDPFFSVNSFISAILLGMLLMFTSSINLFKRITRLDAGELLSKYSTKQEKPYNPGRDVKILVFTAVCLVVIGFLDQLDTLIYNVDNIIFTLALGAFVFIVVPVMVIASPYIIIVIGIRLATRGSNRSFARLAEIAEMLTGELGYLIRRGISTGTRRIVNLTTVLSVLFAFLVLTSTFTYAQQDLEERTIKTEVGADMQVLLDGRLSENDTGFLIENLSALDGILSTLPLFITNMGFQIPGKGYYEPIVINSTRYHDLVYVDDDLISEGERDTIRHLRNGGVIVSDDFVDETNIGKGDTVTLRHDTWKPGGGRKIITFDSQKVLGVMKSLPGVHGDYDYEWEWILFDDSVFQGMMDAKSDDLDENAFALWSSIILLETTSSADEEELIGIIENMDSASIRTVRSASLEIERMRTEPTAESFLLVLRTQLGVLVFISLLASATIVFISSYEKRRERASIMLRGTTRRQLFLLEYGESMVILIYSLIVGLVTGLIAGVVWIFVFNVFEELDTINRSYWPSFSMIPVIMIMIVIFLVAVTISTWKLQKFDLLKFVRWG